MKKTTLILTILFISMFFIQSAFALTPVNTGSDKEYKLPLKPYKDNYGLFLSTRSDIKFQISFKYQLFTANADDILRSEGLSKKIYNSFLKKLYLGYTQKSVWDIFRDSLPFEDHNFNPEFFYCSDEDGCDALDIDANLKRRLYAGWEHESNGRDGDNSRSWNRVYVRPVFWKKLSDNYNFVLAPKVWLISKKSDDNADIEDYLGYADLEMTLNGKDNLNLGATLRRGEKKGSMMFDLSMPLTSIPFLKTWVRFNPYLYFQYFRGYGENLINYNQARTVFRAGLRLF